ncbi:MAG: ThuA domain-containing protein [Draconibacterium sp.]
MKKILLIVCLVLPVFLVKAEPIKVMLVTGGHSFDTVQFFQMFDAMEDIEYEHFAQPFANKEIAKGGAEDFDVIVFYDMWNNIGSIEREAYRKTGEQGKPLLFLHHSLVSYQDWPEFEKIIGGRYVEKQKGEDDEEASTYEHDVWVYCKVENYTSVTRGFKELRFFDEIYGNVRVSDEVLPLLSTRHPKSMEYVAWENRYKNSRVIYIQPGHDKRTFSEPDYRKLLLQAIHSLAGK